MLSSVLDCSRSELYLEDQQISAEQTQRFEELLRKRLTGYPVQYLTGKAYFFGLEFKVTDQVFIPRPETEILVQTILDKVRPLLCSSHHPKEQACILDIGTGSGNIPIALTKNGVLCRILAIDISKEAVGIATRNAQLHGVADRVEFTCLDYKKLGSWVKQEQLKLIVSNPPYIRSENISFLSPELQYEPRIALDGGADGLCFYNSIVSQASIYLKRDGYLAIEIGEDQAAAVTEIIRHTTQFGPIEVIKDLNQKDRVILTRKSN